MELPAGADAVTAARRPRITASTHQAPSNPTGSFTNPTAPFPSPNSKHRGGRRLLCSPSALLSPALQCHPPAPLQQHSLGPGPLSLPSFCTLHYGPFASWCPPRPCAPIHAFSPLSTCSACLHAPPFGAAPPRTAPTSEICTHARLMLLLRAPFSTQPRPALHSTLLLAPPHFPAPPFAPHPSPPRTPLAAAPCPAVVPSCSSAPPFGF